MIPDDIPSSKREELITTVKNALSKKKLSALHLYRMADTDESNSVSVITLKQVYLSMLPGLQPDVIFTLLKVLDTNRNGFIEKAEYEIVFLQDKNDLEDLKDEDSRIDYKQSEQSIHSKSQKLDDSVIGDNDLGNNDSIIDEVKTPRKGQSQKNIPINTQDDVKGAELDSDDPSQVGRNIGKELLENVLDPETVFSSADQGDDGIIALPLLVKTLQDYLPNVSRTIIFKAAKYMDSDKDGFVKKGDYLATLGGRPIQPNKDTGMRPSKPSPITEPSKPIDEPITSGAKPAKPSLTPAGPKTWEEPPMLSDRQFYEKIRNIKDLLRNQSISIDSFFEEEEISTALLANRLHSLLPDLSRQTIRQVLKYVDVENNGTIRRDEFDLMIGYDNQKAELEESRLVAFHLLAVE